MLSEFAADMTLLPFTHGIPGLTWVTAQGFVGALDFFLSRRVSPEIGTARVENESIFPSDHYPVRLCLHTLPALPPGNPTSGARFNLGTCVQVATGDLCGQLHWPPFTSSTCRTRGISTFRECPDHNSVGGFRTAEYPGYCPWSSVCSSASPACLAQGTWPLVADRAFSS